MSSIISHRCVQSQVRMPPQIFVGKSRKNSIRQTGKRCKRKKYVNISNVDK